VKGVKILAGNQVPPANWPSQEAEKARACHDPPA
jgi:hypothetical protein